MAGIPPIETRLFVVGCPRSGTTLLQSLISAHPEIVSFPETHFFDEPPARRLLSSIGLASPRWRRRFMEFLSHIGRSDLQGHLPFRGIFAAGYHRRMIALLDRLAAEQHASLWLEKTPGHIFSLRLIEDVAPNAKFIHIVRDGRDVVASLYEVTREYPDVWRGAWPIGKCIDMWNRALDVSTRCCGRPRHFIVHYADLLADPENVLHDICDFIGVRFDSRMLNPSAEEKRSIIATGERWKDRTLRSSIDTRTSGKFERLFSAGQQREIGARLADDRRFRRVDCRGTDDGILRPR